MVKVGLVTGPPKPRALAAPRTKVVFPVPSSPLTSTRCPGRSRLASSAPALSVSSGDPESILMRSVCEIVPGAVTVRRRDEHTRRGAESTRRCRLPGPVRRARPLERPDLRGPAAADRGGDATARPRPRPALSEVPRLDGPAPDPGRTCPRAEARGKADDRAG